jgi:raffinose/stachyose/melibiose transport system substrate-binding protein
MRKAIEIEKAKSSGSSAIEKALSRQDFLKLSGAGLAGVVLLGGCTLVPGETNQGSVDPEGPVSKKIAEKGPVTLEVWDFNTGPINAMTEQLNREFHKKYPNVTIKRTAKTFVDLTGTLKLAMSGEDPPDAATVNQGWPDMGTMTRAGLLLPLDDYAEAYGWKDRFPESVLQQTMFTKDGEAFGTGALFGLPFSAASSLGVFYNKTNLDKLGLQVPEGFEEFQNALKVAKEQGEIPIQMGNLDKIGMLIAYELSQEALQSSGTLRDLIFGRSGASFDTAENLQAAQNLQEWAENGYFTPGFNGLSPEDARKQFANGEGVFTMAGTQDWPTLAEGRGENTGFFLIPPEEPGDPRDATGSPWAAFSISSKSKNDDVAAAYLDFISSSHAGDVAVQNNLPPLLPPENLSGSQGTVYADTLQAQRQLIEEDTFVPYLDWATPNFYDLLTSNLQALAAGKMSPEQFVAEAQSEYTSFHKD